MTRRAGITLLELMLALLLTALVIGIAVRMQGVIATLPADMRMARDSSDRRINAARMLSTLVRTIETGGLTLVTPFEGGTDHVTFASRQVRATGEISRARIDIRLNGLDVVARVDSVSVPVIPCVETLAFQYLLPAAAGAAWVTTFGPSTTPPQALRLRWRARQGCGGATDSVLLRIPEAG